MCAQCVGLLIPSIAVPGADSGVPLKDLFSIAGVWTDTRYGPLRGGSLPRCGLILGMGLYLTRLCDPFAEVWTDTRVGRLIAEVWTDTRNGADTSTEDERYHCAVMGTSEFCIWNVAELLPCCDDGL